MRVEHVTRTVAGLMIECSQPTAWPDTVQIIHLEIPNVRLQELQEILAEPMTA